MIAGLGVFLFIIAVIVIVITVTARKKSQKQKTYIYGGLGMLIVGIFVLGTGVVSAVKGGSLAYGFIPAGLLGSALSILAINKGYTDESLADE